MVYGVKCAMISGLMKMQEWSVDSSDLLLIVSSLIHCNNTDV